MKTTVDLPEDLLIESKAVAAQRQTALKELITRSLRREIGLNRSNLKESDRPFVVGPLGLPMLKSSGKKLSADDYDALVRRIEVEDDENTSAALRRASPPPLLPPRPRGKTSRGKFATLDRRIDPSTVPGGASAPHLIRA